MAGGRAVIVRGAGGYLRVGLGIMAAGLAIILTAFVDEARAGSDVLGAARAVGPREEVEDTRLGPQVGRASHEVIVVHVVRDHRMVVVETEVVGWCYSWKTRQERCAGLHPAHHCVPRGVLGFGGTQPSSGSWGQALRWIAASLVEIAVQADSAETSGDGVLPGLRQLQHPM
ncbi:hypothetical protein HOY80DRAFT_1074234 [Tuber brumale]|nr:hypothetical protein HOY80DRAFT_1074234 [Tuber brumale]